MSAGHTHAALSGCKHQIPVHKPEHAWDNEYIGVYGMRFLHVIIHT